MGRFESKSPKQATAWHQPREVAGGSGTGEGGAAPKGVQPSFTLCQEWEGKGELRC